MCTTIVSVFTGIPVKRITMTGEVTLRGRVLTIGGLKEKLLAALRVALRLSSSRRRTSGSRRDSDNVKNELTIIPVGHVDEVLKHALADAPIPLKTGSRLKMKASSKPKAMRMMTARRH